MALEWLQQIFHTCGPFHHECLCFHPLIVEVCPARWSQRISDLSPSNPNVCCAACAGAATTCCSLLKSAVTKRLHWALSLRTRCPWIAVAQLQDTQSSATPIPCLWASATQEDPQSSTALECKFLTSATQEDFRSPATPVDSRGSATPDVARWILPCGCVAHTFRTHFCT